MSYSIKIERRGSRPMLLPPISSCCDALEIARALSDSREYANTAVDIWHACERMQTFVNGVTHNPTANLAVLDAATHRGECLREIDSDSNKWPVTELTD